MNIINANAEKPEEEPTKKGLWEATCRYPEYWKRESETTSPEDRECGQKVYFVGERQDVRFLKCKNYHKFRDKEPHLEYKGELG